MTAPFVFNDVIKFGQVKYILRDEAIKAGWNQVDPLVSKITVDPRFLWRQHPDRIGTQPALDCSGSFPAGSSFEVYQEYDYAVKEPPFGSKRAAAFEVYKPPFKYLHGFIYDSTNNMVADDHEVEGAVAARIRGWGKLQYKPDGAKLQDELGQMVAEALTDFWNKPRDKS